MKTAKQSRGVQRSAKKNIAVFMIEGESLSFTQIMDRLGISRVTLDGRMQRARKLPGPVTWERLGR